MVRRSAFLYSQRYGEFSYGEEHPFKPLLYRLTHDWRRLDESSSFRQPGQCLRVRGRCWAIHDGILGRPWDAVEMYKVIGHHAGVDTFPDRSL